LLLLSVETETSIAPLRAVVLVVEDEVVVRNIVCTVLQREGHKVLAAANGLEALDVARRFSGRIDLLVSDVEMPELDGFSLVDRIRPERPDLRVLLMSGKLTTDVPGDKKHIPFLRKPFRSGEFLAKVRETLGHPS
jgi:CheY-like chemotaxis protein